MKTFIVPTDFSETAKNSALFAVQAAEQAGDTQVILYNMFNKVAIGSDGSPLDTDHNARHNLMMTALQNLKTELLATSNVPITCVAEEGSSLEDNLEKFARYQMGDLIIMGINGASRLEQILIGSNTLNMVSVSSCPVIIVPPNASFKKIHNVMFCSDFKDVAKTTPIKPLEFVLDLFKPTLHIVNVDSEHHVELTAEYKAERGVMENLLGKYNPEFYFIRMFDVVEALNQFASDKNIDLIITIPRRHSFLSGLFRTSYTKKLAYHSHVPIAAIQA